VYLILIESIINRGVVVKDLALFEVSNAKEDLEILILDPAKKNA